MKEQCNVSNELIKTPN